MEKPRFKFFFPKTNLPPPPPLFFQQRFFLEIKKFWGALNSPFKAAKNWEKKKAPLWGFFFPTKKRKKKKKFEKKTKPV